MTSSITLIIVATALALASVKNVRIFLLTRAAERHLSAYMS